MDLCRSAKSIVNMPISDTGRMSPTNINPPYDCGLVFTSTSKVRAIVTPFDMPHLVGVDVQNSCRRPRKRILAALVVFKKRECFRIKRCVVVCTLLPFVGLSMMYES
jgi:hypothetical protein